MKMKMKDKIKKTKSTICELDKYDFQAMIKYQEFYYRC